MLAHVLRLVESLADPVRLRPLDPLLGSEDMPRFER